MTATPHRLDIRIYYEDTDFSGVVYHASYLRFLERGRTELLRSLGIHHAALHVGAAGASLAFAVRAMTLDFLRPALMDDMVTVETWPLAVGGASLGMSQRILRGETLLLTAAVRIVAVAGGRAVRLPRDLRERLVTAQVTGR